MLRNPMRTSVRCPANRSKSLVWALIFLMGLLGLGAAEPVSVRAPWVVDEAQLFTSDRVASLSASLEQARQQSGVDIRVYVRPSSGAGSASASASAPSASPNLTLVYTLGGERQLVLASPSLWERYPTVEMAILLDQISERLNDTGKAEGKRVLYAAEHAMGRLSHLDLQRRIRERGGATVEVKLAILFGGALLLIGAPILFRLVWRMRRPLGSHASCTFPEVEVPPRLGAAFGGGKLAISPLEEASPRG